MAEELPRWVPGKLLLASDTLGWRGVKLRSYRYDPLDVEVPPLRDFMIVAYRRGPTTMDRRIEGPWHHEDLIPGDVSLLTRVAKSHWVWTHQIEVVHIYLTKDFVAEVCEDVFEREIADVHLQDILKSDDPVLYRGAAAIANEVSCQNLGGSLYVDAIARQMCISALRNFSTVSFRDTMPDGGLSRRQVTCITDFIESHLEHSLTLPELAREANISSHHFLRWFKRHFGRPPHAYVIERRLERAKSLLSKTDLPLKEVALRAGFSDQPHMTRLFRRYLDATPKAFRCSTRN
jgi:AraC family transcriptional regulator